MSDRKRSVDWQTAKIFWRELYREPKLFWLALLHPIARLLLNVIMPLLLGRMLASLVLANSEPFSYLPFIIGVAMAGVIANRLGARSFFVSQARTMARLQLLAYDMLLRRSVGFHNNHVSGKLVSDVLDYPASFNQIYGNILDRLLTFSLIVIGGTIFVFAESWQLGVVVLVMSLFVFVSSYFSHKQRKPLRAQRRAVQSSMTAHLSDSLVNIQSVITFAKERREQQQQHKLTNRLRDLRVTQWSHIANSGNNRIIVLITLQILLAYVLVLQVQQQPELLGIGIFVFIFATTIFTRFFELDEITRTTDEAFLHAQPVTEMLTQETEIVDAPGARQLDVTHGAITLQDVQFAYSDAAAHDHVFTQLSLKVAPGEKIGLVGSSGGGKSTLTRLLLRFEDIQAGSISIDGQDIATVTQESLRGSIGYVPQEPLLFHRSIAENIAYAEPNATFHEIVAAAKQAFAHNFIEQLPNGYDTIVGERGVKLSGGQRQRIAIARAILKNAPILVLDEATSALDSESEVYIQKALAKLMQGKTTIVIAHRLSTIQRLDRIIVLDNGKIVEEGSHKELLAANGTYAKLWSHQSGGFIEE